MTLHWAPIAICPNCKWDWAPMSMAQLWRCDTCNQIVAPRYVSASKVLTPENIEMFEEICNILKDDTFIIIENVSNIWIRFTKKRTQNVWKPSSFRWVWEDIDKKKFMNIVKEQNSWTFPFDIALKYIYALYKPKTTY